MLHFMCSILLCFIWNNCYTDQMNDWQAQWDCVSVTWGTAAAEVQSKWLNECFCCLGVSQLCGRLCLCKAALMSLLSVLFGLSAVEKLELEPHPNILFMLLKPKLISAGTDWCTQLNNYWASEDNKYISPRKASTALLKSDACVATVADTHTHSVWNVCWTASGGRSHNDVIKWSQATQSALDTRASCLLFSMIVPNL